MKVRMLLIAAAILAAGSFAIHSLRADQATRCTPNGANQTVCRIDEPIVTMQLANYPQVVFHAGDRITVSAGGCVQTGGHGSTWKRYVNPSGDNSNRMYWGTISIPGATQGVVRISEVIGKTLTVGAGIPDPLFLRLGYVDDGYSDNGYYSHDDGTENQCKNQPNAFVVLTITHQPGTITSCAGNSGNSPLDLVWTDCDPNGFPLNPRWRYEVANNHVPPAPLALCPTALKKVTVNNAGGGTTTVDVIDFPQSCISWPVNYDSGFWCGPHVNYFAATYQGPVNWWQKSTAGTDDDYNYRMYPLKNEGVLAHEDGSTDGMEIEFDSDETIDHFSSPLWSKFHQMVDNNNSGAQAYIKGNTAVVTSLFELDCGHPACSSEEHPAYAMAVDMDSTNLSNDQWGVFARNWGDEGFCSSNQHNLPGTDLKLQIPWLQGATAVAVLPETQFYVFSNSDSNATVPTPQITVANGQGILIDFTLPDPSAQMGVEGEVHLLWTVSAAARSAIITRARSHPLLPREPEDEEKEKPENRMAALFTGLAAPQRTALQSRLATTKRTQAISRRLPARPVVTVAKLPAPPHLARPVIPAQVRDARLAQKSENLRVAICDAYKNKVPGYPMACQPNPRGH
jgi:hypothetical protein